MSERGLDTLTDAEDAAGRRAPWLAGDRVKDMRPRLRLSRPRFRSPAGLSTRLLLLTGVFAVVVEALIVAPSAASFHERWLLDRVRVAEAASVGVEALPYSEVEDDTARQLLEIGGVQAIAVGEQGVRRLLLEAPTLSRAPDFIDLRQSDWVARTLDPWRTLLGPDDRSIRVMARPRYRSGDFIEVIAPVQPLKAELREFLLQSLLLSLLISALAGTALYAALAYLVLAPMRRVTASIERFRAEPEAPSTVAPSGRRDEIGRVEEELDRMQEEVRGALRSRARLVALGEAVAKINHDLRNMLTSAQLASERLAASADPNVAKALPRLERALNRAAALAQNTLDYGRSEEPPPVLARLPLGPALSAAAEDAGLERDGVRLEKKLPARATIHADADQLHRILVNLMKNARQAIQADVRRQGRGVVRVTAKTSDDRLILRIADDGPGIPDRLAERLFQPFVSGGGQGAGLGLTISRELAANHGGVLNLIETGPRGTVFELALPV
ncbi:sensor histidine kinase [Brevundimonas lutea]|uniref:sensor histidine kinase n=1 Tax=Brevundimonas lutea TaxID=2293980 RepID=UPI001F0BF8AB|nr:HAMP domain-containing sensor histidine kinase [Brevundimonas lutea]